MHLQLLHEFNAIVGGSSIVGYMERKWVDVCTKILNKGELTSKEEIMVFNKVERNLYHRRPSVLAIKSIPVS